MENSAEFDGIFAKFFCVSSAKVVITSSCSEIVLGIEKGDVRKNQLHQLQLQKEMWREIATRDFFLYFSSCDFLACVVCD